MTLTTRADPLWRRQAHSVDTLTSSYHFQAGGTSSATAWGTQYRAIYVPVRVPYPGVVKEMWVNTGSTGAGNIDVGLYDAAGTRLVSTGSTAHGAGNTLVAFEVTDTTIQAGLYYLALNNDTTTDTFRALTTSAALTMISGVLSETLGAVTLPATATWAVDTTLAFLPKMGALFVTELA